MTVKTIYIARHGYRSNWLPNGPYPPPPTGVDSDVPLAAHGVQQAQELAHYIMSIPDADKPELLFSSPFYRCVQTIYPTSELLDVDITIERGLGEWFKPDRDVVPVPTSVQEMQKLFVNKKTKLEPEMWSTVIPNTNGETEELIRVRCHEFWPLFIQKIEKEYPDCEKIMLCTHAATKIALGMNLLGFSDLKESIDDKGSTIRSGACSIDKYELLFDGDASDNFYEKNWVLTMNGNTQFLSAGEEMHWDFRNGFEAGSDADIAYRRKLQESKEGKQDPNNTKMDVLGDKNGDTADATKADKKDEGDDSDEYETEEVYVSVNLPQNEFRTYNKIDTKNTTFQSSGLETKEPLMKIGDKVYKGKWNRLVGTEVVMDSGSSSVKKELDGKTPGASDEASPALDGNTEHKSDKKDATANGTEKSTPQSNGEEEGTVVKVVEHELQLEEVHLK